MLRGKSKEYNVKFCSTVIIYMLVISSFLGLFIIENDNLEVEAATYYVGGTGGGNYSKIQDAIDNASSGDTVYVYSGTYNGTIVINKSISLIGENVTNTIINGSGIINGTGNMSINGSGNGSVIYVNASGVKISGFTVRNSGSGSWDAGIGLYNVQNCSINNNNVTFNGHLGIFLHQASNNNIENNNIYSNIGSGIYLYLSISNNITNNELNDNIRLRYSRNNTIESNNISGTSRIDYQDGINIYDFSDNNSINNNNIIDWRGDGVRIYSTKNNNISNNNINNNGRGGKVKNGISIYSSYNNTFTGNTISNNGNSGIFSRTSNNLITFNKIYNNSYGIYYWDYYYHGNEIYLNEFIGNINNVGDSTGYHSLNSTQPISYVYNGENYTNYLGNYWDDYNGTDGNGDGIGDSPHNLSGSSSNKDYFPLMKPIDYYLLIPSTIKAELNATSSKSINMTASLKIQNAKLNASVTGSFTGTINFTNLEVVTLNSSSFIGKGFFKADWTGIIEGKPYKGTWHGMLFNKTGDGKIYLKGTVFGGLKGLTDGYLIESSKGSGNYDLYNSSWTISHIGSNLVFAKLTLNGTADYQNSSIKASRIYILQALFIGNATGYYNGSLNVVLTHIRIIDNTSKYYGYGFSIISYVSTYGTGTGWTYDKTVFKSVGNKTVSTSVVKLTGFFTDPLWGLVFGTLDERGPNTTLSLIIVRINLGLPPTAIVRVIVWGPWGASPGQTINYMLEYRNYGLKAAYNTEIVMVLPTNTIYKSNTGGGSYNSTTHKIIWVKDILPKSINLVSVKCKVKWSLSLSTKLLCKGYVRDVVKNVTLARDSFTTIVRVGVDPNIKYGTEGNVTLGQQLNYTIEFENEGSGIAFGVYFTDELSENLNDATLQIGPVKSASDGSVMALPGIYNPETRTITWLAGTIGPGEGGYTNISINVRNDLPHGTEIINYGTVFFPSVPEITRTNGIIAMVRINQPPVANAGQNLVVSTLQNIIFDGSGSVDPVGMIINYTWDFGDGEIGYGKTTSHAYLDDGNYVVNLTVKDDDGATDSHEINVQVLNRLPEAKLEVNFNVVKTNEQVTFDAIKSSDLDGNVMDYYFDFGDGTNSGWVQTASISHSYSDGTITYKSKLKVRDDDGAISTNLAEVEITVNNREPEPNLSVDPINAFTYEDISCNAELSSDLDGIITSYYFDFGDGTTSGWITTSSISHQYTDGTKKYTISLKVKDDDGVVNTDIPTAEITIKNRKPVPSLVIDNTDIYTLEEVTFDASGSYDQDGNDLEYYFDFGDGSNSDWGTDAIVKHTYLIGPKEYTILLKVKDSDGEINTTSFDILVKNLAPVANAGLDQSVFVNQIVNFDGSGSYDSDGSISSYNWAFGDGTTSGWSDSTKTTHSYDEPGNYTVTLTVTDGLLSDEDTCIILVSEVEEAYPIIDSNFPTLIELDEDFGEFSLKLTEFELHENTEYTGDDLKWYVEGNSGTIFHISGDNSIGENADTFIFTSISNKYGNELLTYHLYGPENLEATIEQTVKVYPVNDAPIIKPWDDITVNLGEEKTLNLKDYVLDVETAFSDLILTTDYPDYINIEDSRLIIKFDELGDYSVQLKVNDGELETMHAFTVFVLDPNDLDSDGLPDAWEELYNLDPTDPSDAQLDIDDDSLSNFQEYGIGTDPTMYDTDSDGIHDGLDQYPTDPTRPARDKSDGKETENIYLMLIIIIFVIILIIGILTSLIIKSKNIPIMKPFDDDKLIRQLRDEVIRGYEAKDPEMSDTELWTELEKNYQDGEISEETYELIEQEKLDHESKPKDNKKSRKNKNSGK